MVWDIRERTFQFAVSTIAACNHVQSGRTADIVLRQLIRSATSVGANVEEGSGAQSRPDFARKLTIALGEAREACYWMRLVKESHWAAPAVIEPLLDEGRQIARILGAIISTLRGTRKGIATQRRW